MHQEIVLPITSPETEWVLGRPRIKMSANGDHARVQLAFGSALLAWAGGRGETGTEWRFRIEPPGQPRRPLVPDIAFVSREQIDGYSDEELLAPPFAPAVAIEVLSPGDAAAVVREKIDVYLKGGSRLVIIVDPQRRTMQLHDRDGVRHISGDDELLHAALPDFGLRVGEFFASTLDRRR